MGGCSPGSGVDLAITVARYSDVHDHRWTRIEDRLFELDPQLTYPGMVVAVFLTTGMTDRYKGTGEKWGVVLKNRYNGKRIILNNRHGRILLRSRKRAKEHALSAQADIRFIYDLGLVMPYQFLHTNDLVYCVLRDAHQEPKNWHWQDNGPQAYLVWWVGDKERRFTAQVGAKKAAEPYFDVVATRYHGISAMRWVRKEPQQVRL